MTYFITGVPTGVAKPSELPPYVRTANEQAVLSETSRVRWANK